MSVKIDIHVTHRQHTKGLKTIEVKGNTVGQALNNFTDMYPGMKNELFDKKGALLHYVEIYLNQKSAYPNELETEVKDGDQIQITTFLAGG